MPESNLPTPFPDTITATVPVLDQKACDALAETLRAQGYEEVWFENVTRITAKKTTPDSSK